MSTKKSAAKKSTAKKGAAKKSTAKKGAAKKSAAKKSTAKKGAAKKSTAVTAAQFSALKQEVGGLKGRVSQVEKLVKNHSDVLSDLTTAVEEHDRVLVDHSRALHSFVSSVPKGKKAPRDAGKTVMMPAFN